MPCPRITARALSTSEAGPLPLGHAYDTRLCSGVRGGGELSMYGLCIATHSNGGCMVGCCPLYGVPCCLVL